MQKRSASIRDVARRAGVSIASVSRALNHPEQVSVELRERIDAAAQALGYVPDGSARAMSSRTTRTIGALVPTLDNAMYARGIDALQKRLAAEGYLLLIATTGYDPAVEWKQAHNMLGRGVDGLVLRGDVHTAELRRMLDMHAVPFINVGVYHPHRPYASVGVDNEAAAHQACRYLLQQGHREIGMVAALSGQNDRSAARIEGVRRALREGGLALPEDWLVEVPYRLDDAREAARQLLGRQRRPSAIVCGNDVLAHGVILEAEHGMGIPVPRALSVIGFDDLELSRHLRPALTTMRLPIDEIWNRAGDYLLNSLNGRPASLHHEVDATLVVRESVAPFTPLQT
jgi:LacI family transcriptional regulator